MITYLARRLKKTDPAEALYRTRDGANLETLTPGGWTPAPGLAGYLFQGEPGVDEVDEAEALRIAIALRRPFDGRLIGPVAPPSGTRPNA